MPFACGTAAKVLHLLKIFNMKLLKFFGRKIFDINYDIGYVRAGIAVAEGT